MSVNHGQLMAQTQSHQQASDNYHFDGVMLLELAQNARRLYVRQPPQEKRRLLDTLLSNCTWGGNELKPTLKQPFDLIAETNTKARTVTAAAGAKIAENEIWLGDLDSNQGKRSQSPLSYR
jgi:site-specific DNA recombinase